MSGEQERPTLVPGGGKSVQREIYATGGVACGMWDPLDGPMEDAANEIEWKMETCVPQQHSHNSRYPQIVSPTFIGTV